MHSPITRRAFATGAAASAAALIAEPARAQSWDAIVAAAHREGELSVHGGPGRAYTESFAENFRKDYPGIKINFTGGPSSAAIPRIMRERESGIFSWDVFVGGAPSAFPTLKKTGAFAPLQPILRPDIIDDKIWLGGFADGWLDQEKRFSYAFDFTPEGIIWVNRDFISRDSLKTVQDLLKPEFSGKIAWSDPRSLGEGIFASQVFYMNFGEGFLETLFTKQKIAYPAQRRQASEWLVRGRYPIGISASPDDLAIFRAEGLGKNIELLSAGLTKEIGGAGFGCVQMMERAPHPNAARVYINWLLGQKAQEAYARVAKRNSRRTDATPGNPEFAARKVDTYLNAQAEDQMQVRFKVTAIAKEKIPSIAQ